MQDPGVENSCLVGVRIAANKSICSALRKEIVKLWEPVSGTGLQIELRLTRRVEQYGWETGRSQTGEM